MKIEISLMTPAELKQIAERLNGQQAGSLERLSQLTAINKSILSRYASGERPITQSHALFIRALFYLHNGFPDLANDFTVMTRQPIMQRNRYPHYEDIKNKATLLDEIAQLKAKLAKIQKISDL